MKQYGILVVDGPGPWAPSFRSCLITITDHTATGKKVT